MVVVVAYFGSRTNLIILPQASHKPHKPTLPNLTFPLVLLSCCTLFTLKYASLHWIVKCISLQYDVSVFKCTTSQQNWFGLVSRVESKNCRREGEQCSLASDNEAFCSTARPTFVVKVHGCYYYTLLAFR